MGLLDLFGAAHGNNAEIEIEARRLSAQLQQLQQIATGALHSPTYLNVENLAHRKIRLAIDRLISELPLRLLTKVKVVRCGPEGAKVLHFEVVFFQADKTITFDNVDTFPTDADIARICVEAP